MAEISRYAKLGSMKDVCIEHYKKMKPNAFMLNASDIRVWKLEQEVSLSDFMNSIKTSYPNRSRSQGNMDLPSKSTPIGYCRHPVPEGGLDCRSVQHSRRRYRSLLNQRLYERMVPFKRTQTHLLSERPFNQLNQLFWCSSQYELWRIVKL